jgi:hypothetical protein
VPSSAIFLDGTEIQTKHACNGRRVRWSDDAQPRHSRRAEGEDDFAFLLPEVASAGLHESPQGATLL